MKLENLPDTTTWPSSSGLPYETLIPLGLPELFTGPARAIIYRSSMLFLGIWNWGCRKMLGGVHMCEAQFYILKHFKNNKKW